MSLRRWRDIWCGHAVVFLLMTIGCSDRTSPPALNTRAEKVVGRWLTYQMAPSHNAVLPSLRGLRPWIYDDKSKINGGLAVVGHTLFFDDFDGRVNALDVLTGRLRWSWKSDNVLMSTPIVAGNRVYVGSGDNGSMTRPKGSFAYTSGTGAPGDVVWGRPQGDHLFALDAARGTLTWKYRTLGEDMPSPAFVHDSLVFANGDAHAYALSAGSGAAMWRHRLQGIATMASATPMGSGVLVSDCDFSNEASHTYFLDGTSGRERWAVPYGNCDSSPTIGGGRVYLSGVNGNAQSFGFGGRAVVVAVDARSGSVVWTFRSKETEPYTAVGSNERAVAGTFADDTYFQAMPSDDTLSALDARSGSVRWVFRTRAPVKMSPIVANNRVYFGDVAGLFYVLDEKSGALLRTRIFNSPFTTSPPILIGDWIIVANGTSVAAFRAP